MTVTARQDITLGIFLFFCKKMPPGATGGI
jgi:hypothetical protein